MNQAFDLSNLAAKNASINQSNEPLGAAASLPETVESWLVPVDDAGLRRFIDLSKLMPVILLVGKRADPQLNSYSSSLAGAIGAAGGRVAGCEIDFDSNPRLAQALQVRALPALYLLLEGNPRPLSDGMVPVAELGELVRQLAELASQQGMPGRVAIGQSKPEPVDDRIDKAGQLIEEGKLDDAATVFEAILRERPADRDARAGLGQVRLLVRLQKPGDLPPEQKQLLPADQLFAAGQFEQALQFLLDEFASAEVEFRGRIRERLVEFFGMVGDDEPMVSEARRRLSSMLF